ncbi:unnamed protein product [Penicillium viridicatum]
MTPHDPSRVASIMLSRHSLDLVSCTKLQTLWAGYGQICAITARATTTKAAEHLSNLYGVEPGIAGTTYPLILKLISPPRKSGTADEGHLRKMLSYEVEQYFYSEVVPQLGDDISIAKCLASTRDMDDAEGSAELKGLMATVMVRAALDWLAGFHSRSRGLLPATLDEYVLPPLEESSRRQSSGKDVGNGLWLNGGYTYLATRGKEYASLAQDTDSEWSDVLCGVSEGNSLSVAEMVALFLTPRGRAIESYIHGDVKSENLFTTTNGDKVAFFDFQYVGLGLGVCDLAKLFTCSIPLHMLVDGNGSLPEQLSMCDGERGLLERYRMSLLQDEESDEAELYEWEAFKRHWETALVDWCRFQASWGFWGNTEWLEARVRSIVNDQEWRDWLYQNIRSRI